MKNNFKIIDIVFCLQTIYPWGGLKMKYPYLM